MLLIMKSARVVGILVAASVVVVGCSGQSGDHIAGPLTWTQATPAAAFAPRQSFGAVAFAGKLWVIGGGDFESPSGQVFFNDVWSSSDGVTWTQVTGSAGFSPRWAHTAIVFKDRIWVIGGSSYAGGWTSYADVWSSSDGVSWTSATENAAFGTRQRHTTVVFAGKLWVIGGEDQSDDDVWSSADGVSWTLATPSISTAPLRFNHSSVVYGDRIWTMFGDDGSWRQDVVSSTDGVTWNNVAYGTIIEKRTGHSSVVFDDAMWVIAGTGAVQFNTNDYSSRDGVTWTANTSSTALPRRENAAAVVFDGHVWVLGGFYFLPDRDGTRNDVWRSE